MADISDTKQPYEILIRFKDGVPSGMHIQYLRRVMMGDELLKEEITPATPFDLDGLATSDLMSDAARAAFGKIHSLQTFATRQTIAAALKQQATKYQQVIEEHVRRPASKHDEAAPAAECVDRTIWDFSDDARWDAMAKAAVAIIK